MKRHALIILTAIASQASFAATSQDTSTSELEQERILDAGSQLLAKREPGKAINDYFNRVIDYCDKNHTDKKQQIYAARTQAETLFYLMGAAIEERDAKVLGPLCADALYLKGYALLEIGNDELAQQYISMALAMSPVNSRYLAELGHIHQYKREWDKALELFRKAEDYADTYSPDDIKNLELSRAKRGIGYSFIELGRLDEAEKKFLECIEINDNDSSAIRELKYIEKLR